MAMIDSNRRRADMAEEKLLDLLAFLTAYARANGGSVEVVKEDMLRAHQELKRGEVQWKLVWFHDEVAFVADLANRDTNGIASSCCAAPVLWVRANDCEKDGVALAVMDAQCSVCGAKLIRGSGDAADR